MGEIGLGVVVHQRQHGPTEHLGVPDRGILGLCHTSASIGVVQGRNLPVIDRLLGHSQASTTQRYAHVDIDPALTAANRIGPVVSGVMGIEVSGSEYLVAMLTQRRTNAALRVAFPTPSGRRKGL